MEMIRVGILLGDVEYAFALARGLAKESRTMEFHIGEEDGMDVYLTEESFSHLPKEKCIYLTYDREKAKAAENVLYRYEDAITMVRQIVSAYYYLTGERVLLQEISSLRVVAITQSCGGSGSTAIALSVGQLLNRIYGKKCLYLNLGAVDDSLQYGTFQQNHSLLQLLYRLEQKEPAPLEDFLEGLGETDRISLEAINGNVPEFTLEHLQNLLDELAKMGEYDVLFLDMGGALTRANLEMLAHCDDVIFVYRWKDRNKKLVHSVRKKLKPMARRFIGVCNRCSAIERERGGQDLFIREAEDGFLDQGDWVELELHNAFGLDMMQIAQKIEERETEGMKDDLEYRDGRLGNGSRSGNAVETGTPSISAGWMQNLSAGIRVSSL